MLRLAVQPSDRLAILVIMTMASTGAPLQAQGTDSVGAPPAGFGTLRQDDVAMRLATATLQIRILPLDERIIRLMAPDTYRSLRQLRETRTPEIDRATAEQGGRRSTLFLVTFFGLERGARFTPEDITITSQNRFFRPVAIIPLSPQWSALELRQRETMNAIYLYEDGIPLLEPFTVSYGAVASTAWEQVLWVLERERSRVYSRATTGRGRGSP